MVALRMAPEPFLNGGGRRLGGVRMMAGRAAVAGIPACAYYTWRAVTARQRSVRGSWGSAVNGVISDQDFERRRMAQKQMRAG